MGGRSWELRLSLRVFQTPSTIGTTLYRIECLRTGRPVYAHNASLVYVSPKYRLFVQDASEDNELWYRIHNYVRENDTLVETWYKSFPLAEIQHLKDRLNRRAAACVDNERGKVYKWE